MFEETAEIIRLRCEELYWHVPNNVKKEQIHVKSWNVPASTAKILYMLCLATKSKRILELGTSCGYSTIWLGQAAKILGGHVNTIEYFKPKCNVAKQHFIEANVQKLITLHESPIIDVLPTLNQEFDLIFMDADRGNYDKYFPYLYKLLKVGGLIVVDNAGNYKDRMVRFLKQCEESIHEVSYTLEVDNGLLFYRK